MRLDRTKFAVCLLCFSLACTVPQVLANKEDKAAPAPTTTLSGARCTRLIG